MWCCVSMTRCYWRSLCLQNTTQSRPSYLVRSECSRGQWSVHTHGVVSYWVRNVRWPIWQDGVQCPSQSARGAGVCQPSVWPCILSQCIIAGKPLTCLRNLVIKTMVFICGFHKIVSNVTFSLCLYIIFLLSLDSGLNPIFWACLMFLCHKIDTSYSTPLEWVEEHHYNDYCTPVQRPALPSRCWWHMVRNR